MYVLKYEVNQENQERGRAIIDVYDLGLLGTKFAKVVTITEQAIVKVLQDNIGIHFASSRELSSQYRIVDIHPLQCNESRALNFLLLTQNGLRIYIKLDTVISSAGQGQDQLGPQQVDQFQQSKLQFDHLYPHRPGYSWQISSIHSIPSTDDAEPTFLAQPDPFRIVNLMKPRPQGSRIMASDYQSDSSCLVVCSGDDASHFSSHDSCLTLQFIMKNESQFAYFRDVVSDSGS